MITSHHQRLIDRIVGYALVDNEEVFVDMCDTGSFKVWSLDGNDSSLFVWSKCLYIVTPIQGSLTFNDRSYITFNAIEYIKRYCGVNLLEYADCRMNFELLFPFLSMRKIS